jgi:hypothetical protein
VEGNSDQPSVIGKAVTSRDLRRSRRSRPRARQTSSPPPSTTVQSLMEMGFPRKAVEHAAKALGGIGDMTPSPESIVGWLLEHQALVRSVYSYFLFISLGATCSENSVWLDSSNYVFQASSYLQVV